MAACHARHGNPEILTYDSIDTILDAHPDFNDARRVLAERREQLIAHILRTQTVSANKSIALLFAALR